MSENDDQPAAPLTGWRRSVAAIGDAAAALVDWLGHAASAVLLMLTVGIVLGISLRWAGIDNSWTYDFDLFTLVGAGFGGAAFTALRGRHVTAGIALENVLGGRGNILSLIRFVIVVGFLILFLTSGYWDTLSSFQTHETTIDVDQWPMWVAKMSLPIGAAGWAIAELAKFLRQLAGVAPAETGELALDE
ncbi:MAG TPA: TRAP transporter small permease [Pseudolabrys sp.]|nr:TRAP transporter small permease [Pseudolabrys sp.]